MEKYDYFCSMKVKVKRNMKYLEFAEHQEYLAFNEQDLIMIDKIQDFIKNHPVVHLSEADSQDVFTYMDREMEMPEIK
jgi:hypothetical protein